MAEIPFGDRDIETETDRETVVGAVQPDMNQGGGGQSVVVRISVFFISFILKLQPPPHKIP